MEQIKSASPDVLAARVFGSDLGEDILYSDLLTTPIFLFGSLDAQSIIRFEARRMSLIRESAVQRLRQGAEVMAIGRARTSTANESVIRSIEGMTCMPEIETGRVGLDDTDRLERESATAGLEIFANELQEAINHFNRDPEVERAMILLPEAAELRFVFERFAEIFENDHEQLRDRLTDAFGYFQDALKSNQTSTSPAVWFFHGWCLWRLGNDPILAQRAVSEAIRTSHDHPSAIRWLASRLLAHMKYQVDDFDGAYEASCAAVSIRPDSSTLMENAGYATRIQKIRESRQTLTQAITANPYVAVRFLACSNYAISAREIVDALATQLPKLRDLGHTLCQQWHGASKRVEDVAVQLGRKELVSSELLSGHHELSRALSTSGVFLAWFIQRTAEASRRALVEQAKEAIGREIDRCEDLRKESEHAVEQVQRIRDAQLRELQSSRDFEAASVRNAVKESMRYESMIHQGCGLSLGIAVTGYGVFAVIAAIGVIRGFAFGLETTWGQVALGLSLTPMALFLIAQVLQGLATMRIDNEVKARIAKIDAALRERVGKVETEYRQQIAHNRQLLDDRSREVRLAREALRQLNAGLGKYEIREKAA